MAKAKWGTLLVQKLAQNGLLREARIGASGKFATAEDLRAAGITEETLTGIAARDLSSKPKRVKQPRARQAKADSGPLFELTAPDHPFGGSDEYSTSPQLEQDGAVFSCTLFVVPRTKKNSGQMFAPTDAQRRKGMRPFIFPSQQAREFEKQCFEQLDALGLSKPCACRKNRKARKTCTAGRRLAFPMNLRAKIYRHAEVGDTIGYLQAIADMLEDAHVVANDKWIQTFDGSEPLKDAQNPRIEVRLERRS